MKKGTKKKGFTLIELIIVIAILGIIAAIAVPKFGSIQKDAKVKADVATAKVIADAALTEIAKNNISVGEVGTPVIIEVPNVRTSSNPSNNKEYLSYALQDVPKSQLEGDYKFYVKIDSNGDVSIYAGKTDKAAYGLYPNLSANYSLKGQTVDVETDENTVVEDKKED